MKKAQVAEQIFVYILAVFLAALILIYGYKAISGFIGKTEDISLVKFQTEITSAVKTISSDYGSVRKLELNIPSKYKKVCIVQLGYADASSTCLCGGNCPTQEKADDYNPIICDAWETQQTQNVFLVPMANVPIKISTVEIDGGYICVNTINGKAVLRIEGLGDRTKVSAWQ